MTIISKFLLLWMTLPWKIFTYNIGIYVAIIPLGIYLAEELPGPKNVSLS